jgi:hypothetical protein
MKLKAHWGFWFCLVTSILAVYSALGRTDAALAEGASNRFHEQLRRAEFKSMYRQAPPYLQRRISEGAFIERMRELRRRIGDSPLKIVREDRTRYLGPAITKGVDTTFVRADYVLRSATDTCEEFIFWQVEDGEAKLFDYSVRCESVFQLQIP